MLALLLPRLLQRPSNALAALAASSTMSLPAPGGAPLFELALPAQHGSLPHQPVESAQTVLPAFRELAAAGS